MSRSYVLVFVSLFGLLSAPLAEAAPTWTFDKATGTALSFKSDAGKTETLKVDSANPSFISILTDPDSGTPYVLYEGRTCAKCEATNTSYYLQRIDGKGKASAFIPPGRITDPKKGLTYEGRFFYGHCLPSVKQGVVVHQREAVDRRGMQKSVVIAEPGPQYVYEVLLERRLPSLKTTLDLVKRKSCFEIAGKSRNVLKKPLDLSPKAGLDDEEEDENDVKEKAGTPSDAAAPATE